jgi:cystathionine gamma-synthase
MTRRKPHEKPTDRRAGLSTIAVHGGQDRKKSEDSITTPIFQTSTFVFESFAEQVRYARLRSQGKAARFEYGRYGSPTQRDAERKVAELEGAESALTFASGMAAVTTAILTFTSSGQHIVCGDEVYKKTRDFCIGVLPRFAVETTFVPTTDLQAIRKALRPTTALVFLECPTNPRLFVPDLARTARLVHENSRALLVVDSTFATPVNLRPLALGVDLVLHSATKYLGGHNDILGGVVAGPRRLIAPIFELQKPLGGIIDAHCAYLLIRGLKTLDVRMRKHNENGLAVARFLAEHPKVTTVYYPGLRQHPSYRLARKQMTGFGGVVSFEVDGDLEAVARFLDSLAIPYLGPSLGGVESLVYHPASLTFNEMSPEEREALGISDQLVRLSCGIEDADDLIGDLAQALDKV